MAFQTKKTVVVPFDISDVINLNHLDVIPCRFQSGLTANSVDIEQPRMDPALTLPNSPMETAKNLREVSSSEHHGHRRSTERSLSRRKSPRTVITKGFDRRGKMTRVVADFTEDSESCECYKQAQLLNNYNLRMRQPVNLADIFSPSSVGSLESCSSSVIETDDESKTCIDHSERSEDEKKIRDRKFEEVGVGETPSAAMIRLSEALKQLESTCSDASEVHEDYRPPHSVLTLRPTRANPLVGPTSSYWRSMMASNSNLGSYLVRDSNQTLGSYVMPSNLKESHNYLQHSTPSSQYTECVENTPPTTLSDQKTAAIWDWVSSKYQSEIPTVLPMPDGSTLHVQDTNATINHPAANPRPKPPRIHLQQVAVARSFSDAGRLTNHNIPLRALENIKFSHTIPPRTPIIEPPPLFGPRTPPVATTKRCIQMTPPSSSTVWSLSPLYSPSSSGFPIAEKSSCSLTPAVNSLASLGDVRSGDDVATCSTASTVTELDCTSPAVPLQNSPKTPSDHYILNLIGQICKPSEENGQSREVEATVGPIVTNIPESVVHEADKEVLTHRPRKEEPMVEIAPIKPRRSVSPCSITASDLYFRKMRGSYHNLCDRAAYVKLDPSVISESRDFDGAPKKQRKKNKKGKQSSNSERGVVEQCTTEDEKNCKTFVKDRDTQTATGKVCKVHPTESASTRLRALKSALPRTPGGSYSFRSRIAEAAIAEYVKAELEASLLSPKPSVKNPKPRLPSLDSFLKKISSSDVKCGCRGRTGPKQGPAPKIRLPQRGTALTKRVPLTARTKPPFKPTGNSPQWHPIPPAIPKINTRINFLKYQQQSLAALIGKSRASKQALVPGAVTGDSKVPLTYSYLSLYPRDFQHPSTRWNSYPNFNKLRGSRNNLTVVFGGSKV